MGKRKRLPFKVASSAGKRGLLERVYAYQGRLLRKAEQQGDEAAIAAILRRRRHVEMMLADFDSREGDA